MTDVAGQVADALAWLERKGQKKIRDEMGPRYGIQAKKTFGVPMREIQLLGKRLGPDHALAEALWKTGWYDARLLTAYVDDPEKVTAAQMERWVRDFDNWGLCDTLTFCLWDRTPHAWPKIEAWSKRKEEFVKRTGFALLASVALHDRAAPEAKLLKSLRWIEAAATDERNFVKKGVSWALRSVGRRAGPVQDASIALSRKLAGSADPTSRWLGKTSLKELEALAKKRNARSKG